MTVAETIAIWCRRCRSACEYGCDCRDGSPKWPLVTKAELKPRIYFAHPVTDYGTERECAAVDAIEAEGWAVENPNQQHHQIGYEHEGMTYFERLAAECDALVFMRFPGGAIGAGVGKEIDAARAIGRPIYEFFDGELHSVYDVPTPILSVDSTRALLAEIRSTTTSTT